jgi:hypothetical protein
LTFEAKEKEMIYKTKRVFLPGNIERTGYIPVLLGALRLKSKEKENRIYIQKTSFFSYQEILNELDTYQHHLAY